MGKKYGNVGDLSYQKAVLNKLERKGSISGAEKTKILTGIYAGKVTKLLGINIDFVTKNQYGILNIAKKAEKQIGLINKADNINKNDGTQYGILNIAKKAFFQANIIGLNIANNVDAQGNFIGLNIAKKFLNQENLIGFNIKAKDEKYQNGLASINVKN
ncbi:MAG: hypothetical protein PHR68_03045 [Candidatus Gracilibacteria bacterium]|nr:hypothetical protein [Candidatus Gracilibacteria bacterium]